MKESRTRLVDALLNRDAYANEVGEVRLIETHVSHLFFIGEYVYKVKKPVNYGFLDFTSLEKRRHYCVREVELNSRISPDVYAGVVPICDDNGHIRVEGEGEVVEYAVKMRRLPPERAMNELLRNDKVSADDINAIAAKIARFHDYAATSKEITALGSIEAVGQNVEENFDQTRKYIGTAITQEKFDDIVAYSRAFLDVKADVFRSRAEAGRVRDGHGDLHSANVFLDDDIHIIDCIEFNDRFRCQDVTEDIAFLAMDLDYFGRQDLSKIFVDRYVEDSGDSGVLELLDFFKGYRAYVRGKVTSFRLDDESLATEKRDAILREAKSYFRLAHSYVADTIPSPTLFLTAGLMGTGKSYVGRELARRWNLDYVSSDATRKALAEIKATEHHYDAYGEGIYSAEFSRKTYDAMYEKAKLSLDKGESILLDATFRERNERERAMVLAKEAKANAYLIECVADDEEIKRRLYRRTQNAATTVSDGRLELFEKQKADWEPVVELSESNHIRLDTTGPQEGNVQELLIQLFTRILSD